jgi:hypothetical protein
MTIVGASGRYDRGFAARGRSAIRFVRFGSSVRVFFATVLLWLGAVIKLERFNRLARGRFIFRRGAPGRTMSDIVGRVFSFSEWRGFEERVMSEPAVDAETKLREPDGAIRSTESLEESGRSESESEAEIESGARRAFWIGLGGAAAAITATIWVMFWTTSAGSPEPSSSARSASQSEANASKIEPKADAKPGDKTDADASKTDAKPHASP